MASTSRVKVTYSAPLMLLSSDQWTQIHRAINAHLPLRTIHWKTASRPSIRTIQELQVQLVAFDTLRDEHTSQIPTSLLERPLVNVYVVTCEDADAYKNTVKKQIRDWLAVVSTKKNQEWLVVLVVRPDTRGSGSNFFQIRSSIMDRIRADFNIGKRDRCVQLAWSPGVEDPVAWAELIAKLKDGVLSAFDAAVNAREDDVRRLDSQRHMPGWNFCQYSILKVSLATSFEGMNLLEDAQLQCDELEVSFFNVLRERNLSFFGKLLDLAPGDDTAPLLSLSRKPYRDLMLANTISVFDYRIYLLALQCLCLGKAGRVADAARKAATFLSGFGRRLRDSHDPLPEHFIEAWTYSACHSVVQQCDAWAAAASASSGASDATFSAAKGELYDLARAQVERLGVLRGHLPAQPPFNTNIGTSPPVAKDLVISCEPIVGALASREAFDKLYISVTNRTIAMYDKGGRRKFALRLHGCIAALDLLRSRNSDAHTTYVSLPAHYAHNSWTGLEAFMLRKALDTHDPAAPRGRAWADAALSFLRTFVALHAPSLIGSAVDDERVYIRGVLEGLKDACADAEAEVVAINHPALVLSLKSPNARQADGEDGSYLDVVIRNTLPCELAIDHVVVDLLGSEGRKFTYTSSSATPLALQAGDTFLTLFCTNPAYGTFALETSDITMARIVFRRAHHASKLVLPSSASGSASMQLKSSMPPLVRVPRDEQDLDLRLGVPAITHLDQPPEATVTIATGRNTVVSATLRLSGPSGGRFLLKEARFDDGQWPGATIECVEEWLVLQGLPSGAEVRIVVPHTFTGGADGIRVTAELDYNPADSERPARSLKTSQTVTTSLPVEVKVQDIFRGDTLFSKFTIYTVSSQHITIAEAKLQPEINVSAPLDIRPCGSAAASMVTVTPPKPATFLFKICSPGSRRERDTLHLRVRYRMLRDELEAIVKRHVRTALEPKPELKPHADKAHLAIMHWLESDGTWADMYSITGELRVGIIPQASEGVDETVKLICESLKANSRAESKDDGDWREMVIPVDLPFMNIISSAQIHLPSSAGKDFYAGRPISMRLVVATSFHWGLASEAAKTRGFRMRFDVEVPVSDWLVCGRKRGEFLAMDGGAFETALTLLPLRHGLLPLPHITVMPLPLAGAELTMGSMALPSAETYQLHGAQRVLVLPRGGRSTFVLDMAGAG
ncbi:trafficking protein particle complex subunit 10 [Auriculariales sp. MPI-PUGE-AT-0066]|nr:trafficking protein particle complex subunit 10 [Auriculariales sp. MPI-PUGE-AT-0066]